MRKQRYTGEETDCVQFSFPSLSVNESMARACVAVVCAQMNPRATELADVKCAVSEAVTNAIVHAYKNRIGIIRIRVTLYSDRHIKVEIRDRGCGIPDVKEARKPLYTTDREGERSGMGFTVMESFSDAVRVSSRVGRGTTVTLYKTFSDPYAD